MASTRKPREHSPRAARKATPLYKDASAPIPERVADVLRLMTVEEKIAQLYLRDPVASVAQPDKELKRFQRITLAPGKSQTLSFTLTDDDLALWDAEMNFLVEPGGFEILLGTSSEDLPLQATFQVPHTCPPG